MHTTTIVPRFVRRLLRITSITLVAFLFLGTLPESASAVSSWSPTLLVNTESFQTIDAGDGTTDIELRFGSTSSTLKFLNATQKFQFNKSLSVVGGLSGSYLTIDGQANFSGAVVGKSSITAKGAISGATLTISRGATFSGAVLVKGGVQTKGTLSGAALRVSGPGEIHGNLSASGTVRADGDLTINDDADSNDAVLTFGNTSGNQTIKFLNGSQRFEFSRSIRVLGTISGSALRVDGNATIGGPLTVTGAIRTKGNLSGSTLTVDGNVTLHGVTYNAPSSQGGANTFLKNDGAGNLTWSATAVGNGSGGIMSMHPEYPGAVYYSTGSSNIGQLTMSGGAMTLENSYQWTSSRNELQRYWISVRGRVPDNFSSWDPVKAVEFRFKTGIPGGDKNHLTLKIRDTAGALQTLTGGLVGTDFTTTNVPALSGTWTPKGYFTVYVGVAAKNTANAAAYASYLNMNFETTTP